MSRKRGYRSRGREDDVEAVADVFDACGSELGALKAGQSFRGRGSGVTAGAHGGGRSFSAIAWLLVSLSRTDSQTRSED